MESYRQTDSYTEFQKMKTTHDLIEKFAAKIPGVKKKNVYKTFPTDPNQPKRPTSAYFLYTADQREALSKKNPDASLTELTKMLGESWRSASDTVKAKYTKKYEKQKAEHEKAMKKYETT